MRPEKKAIIDEVQQRLEEGRFAILADCRGLKVRQMFELRGVLRESGSRLLVVKNTFLRHAAEAVGQGAVAELLSGPTALITGSGEVTEVAKQLKGFLKGNELLTVKGGMLGAQVLSADDMQKMASIPPREILLAWVVGTIAAPMTQFVGVMNQKLASLVYVLKAIEDKKGGSSL